ncbi:23S rRNA pseudouridine(955/2504/2580) synthase RluC [Candidatus Berkiella aquae]|uniref:Pseudouridine synthase n=1 Tax=Candidatus Berkiella aquae TaxID=295108 RepID=A0A0Q9YSK1_9GAMM|nr:23S rRNA pseudouridine(955/2504/2580) synthase RluC [Candidatus Berkiella aquae]MCS5711783.1 23S rRNA pseudouridine(955/2504/2580) synthase RluC [Candidatus Berkiella aquae]
MLASQQPLNQVQQIVVTENHAGQRVDNFLFTLLRGVPKSKLYRIIRKGELRVNKKRVDVSYRLVEGDTVRIPPLRYEEKEVPVKSSPGSRTLKNIEDSIVYEDDHLLIINKPSGIAVHGGSGISWGLIEALRQLRPYSPFLELVHRLDRDTSGCVMIAKKRSMLLHLHECLKTGNIQKNYFALVAGAWRGGKMVEAPLHKYVLPSGERMVKVVDDGKFAQTAVKILESYPQATLLQVSPLTGRTHQIRVHCAFMGHPILGDQKYGDSEKNHQAKAMGFTRLFLHAHQLTIELPNKSERLTVTCPMPSECQQFLAKLKSQT